MTEQALEEAARAAGAKAAEDDIKAHPSKDEAGNYPEWLVYTCQPILNEIEKYGLDGYDLDFEPAGDPLGSNFSLMIEYLSQFIGRESSNKESLLIIDTNSGYGNAAYAKPCNFWIYQKYGSTGGASGASQGDFPSNLDPTQGWVPCQVITTENVGDTYGLGCGVLEQMAGFQPNTVGQQYGHKGGFASFHGQRDWRLEAEGAEKGKLFRYQHHIMGIRAQSKVAYYGTTTNEE